MFHGYDENAVALQDFMVVSGMDGRIIIRVQNLQEFFRGDRVGAEGVRNEGGLFAEMGERVFSSGGQVHRQPQLLRVEAAGGGLSHAGTPVSPNEGAGPFGARLCSA
jgi:hypothetical protein